MSVRLESVHFTVFTQEAIEQFATQVADIVASKIGKLSSGVQQRYLTVEQAAAYIGHSKDSFEYLMRKNLFPVIRKDRLVLIDIKEIDTFMQNQRR